MIGLKEIKGKIHGLVNRMEIEKELQDRGIEIREFPKNFVFTGNPGVAKTTVANILSDMLYEKKIISKGGLVSAGRSSVIGSYMGQTSNNMKSKLRCAKGKVLLIDEAYSLADSDDDHYCYGQEAIDTLVEELGKPEADRVVILAGYPEPMRKFMKTNPGLMSRFSNVINFPDYSPDELFEILTEKVKEMVMYIDCDIRDMTLDYIKRAMTAKDFGNGRFIMNLIDEVITVQRTRLHETDYKHLSDEELQTLTESDFIEAFSRLSKYSEAYGKQKCIGFN